MKFIHSILNSYSQIFFSKDKRLALFIIFVSFFELKVGLCGLVSVIAVNGIVDLLGFSKKEIEDGIFGFNAALLGLGLGKIYHVNGYFLVLFIISILTLVLVSVWIKTNFEKLHLPFLSFPYIITLCIVLIVSRSFGNIEFDMDHLFLTKKILNNSDSILYQFIHFADEIKIPLVILFYFKTLANTFFIYSVFGGMIIAIGLLIFSRIAFTLSLLGFVIAYYFYSLFGANTNDLTYYLQGTNYIFLSLAIGGFFLVPSYYSYLAVALLIPVLVFIQIALNKVFYIFQIPSYTLGFSILTTMFLYMLHQRYLQRFLTLVYYQYYQPEKTLYKQSNINQRFKYQYPIKFSLPVVGEWMVSQGYKGSMTHIGDWSSAIDLVVLDDKMKTYQGLGLVREDFYAYNKPVIAPADGFVYEIVNYVEDNQINELDTEKNWGNSILINHLNGIYSQCSHLKKDSFKVKVGDYVIKGSVLASVGNSGRSPEPHLHFQIQNIPIIGAKTIVYPLSHFSERQNNEELLKESSVPNEGKFVSNINSNPLLIKAYEWHIGKKYKVKNSAGEDIVWEVFTNQNNVKYIYCSATESYLYFANDAQIFSVLDYEGDKNAALFIYYLACYKIVLGYYPNIETIDKMPLHHFINKGLQWVQDFVSPFFIYTSANFSSRILPIKNEFFVDEIEIFTKNELTLFGRKWAQRNYVIIVNSHFVQIKDNLNLLEICLED